ncbi:hypothetical protein Gohar_023521 [Gossypium harknessii]|uniref:Uncharacterized protein n=1 Tax=Gossypium harknessii TaxID=34285 RepID=A0A7J9HFM9_9ROSI|nr:hypothetical protein [Gossypium harknessii]
MGGTKRWVLFKRFMTKEAWRWKCFGSAFKWKRLNIKRSFVDNVVFKLVSVLEAIYLGNVIDCVLMVVFTAKKLVKALNSRTLLNLKVVENWVKKANFLTSNPCRGSFFNLVHEFLDV